MDISEFDFSLPEELIAQHPPAVRGDSRLLVVPPSGSLKDDTFIHFPDYFQAGDVLVLNNTEVIKARLFGQKASGGRVEILIERILDARHAVAHIRASKPPKAGTELLVGSGVRMICGGRAQDLFVLALAEGGDWDKVLQENGHLPLPPYIARAVEADDEARYQTVFASEKGAVAAPTAGLHFTREILQKLRDSCVEIVTLTLHVGAGTFQPVRTQNIEEHTMHRERYFIPQNVVDAVYRARAAGKKVCAVGTTSLRALESAALSGSLKAGAGDTDIFITPGFPCRTADMLLTNFHLPKSTLLMLVSAFAGTEQIRTAYRHAVAEKYRFFSYGDAMLLSNIGKESI